VLTGAATKILFKPKTEKKKAPRLAEVVEIVSGGHKYQVKVKKEVIIAAGISRLL
jgi:hypothetical protein